MSLVDTWLAAGKDGGSKTDQQTLDQLNKDLSLQVRHSRMWEWKNGVHKPPPAAINYMLKISMLYALKQMRPRAKLTTIEVAKLADMLALPNKKDCNK